MKYWWIILMFFSCRESDGESHEVLSSTVWETSKPDTLQYKGPLKLVRIDSTTKCNLIQGFYSLESTIPDSSTLAHIAKFIDSKLYSENIGNANCRYPVMSSAFIYVSAKEFASYEGDWLAMCSMGDVSVNALKLRKLKSK